jgi:hypothetical protein
MHESISRWEDEGGALAPGTLQDLTRGYLGARDASDDPPDPSRPRPFGLPAPPQETLTSSTSHRRG